MKLRRWLKQLFLSLHGDTRHSVRSKKAINHYVRVSVLWPAPFARTNLCGLVEMGLHACASSRLRFAASTGTKAAWGVALGQTGEGGVRGANFIHCR